MRAHAVSEFGVGLVSSFTKASLYVYPFISRNGLVVVEKTLGLKKDSAISVL